MRLLDLLLTLLDPLDPPPRAVVLRRDILDPPQMRQRGLQVVRLERMPRGLEVPVQGLEPLDPEPAGAKGLVHRRDVRQTGHSQRSEAEQ